MEETRGVAAGRPIDPARALAADADARPARRGESRAVTPENQARVRAAADRHSRRVRLLKVVLPGFAVLVALLIGSLTWLQSHFQVGIDMKRVLFSKDGLTMVEPRLTGHAKERSYDVLAQKAVQNLQNPKIIELEGIDGRIEMANGTWSKVEATSGTYDGTKEKLELEGKITVTTSSGWQAFGSVAHVDLSDGHMVTDRRNRIVGRAGWIEADALDLEEGGHHAVFTGNVIMEVQPAAAPDEPSSTPPAATR